MVLLLLVVLYVVVSVMVLIMLESAHFAADSKATRFNLVDGLIKAALWPLNLLAKLYKKACEAVAD